MYILIYVHCNIFQTLRDNFLNKKNIYIDLFWHWLTSLEGLIQTEYK